MVFLDTLFYAFIAVVLVQGFFYLFFFARFAFASQKKEPIKNIAVSVIICAKNEAGNLKALIPSILNQDYASFEIILINDASNDNTLDVMEAFAVKNDNVKIVNVKNNEAFWGNKKYALSLGIKASKYDFLLLTDADCKPVSKYWIKEMCSHFSNIKTIVLGYGKYAKIKRSFLNKLIRFETLVTAIQYFSFAKVGLPYMGVGRNLAYRKDVFFNANGFMNHMDIRSGDDDLFINQVATAKNTDIVFSKESFTVSLPKTTFRSWFRQKKRHVSTAKHYKFVHIAILTSLYLSQLLFWILTVILFANVYKWNVVLVLFLFRMIIQFVIFTYSAKKLEEKYMIVLLPFLELFLILMQLTIFISNLISKPNHWR